MSSDPIERAKELRKTFKGTNGEFVEKIGKPAMEAHNKAARTKALEKKKEVVHKRIAGQMNHIVDGHYFNDRKGAEYFAKTGKTLKGQEAR